jgi:hypothetical protein
MLRAVPAIGAFAFVALLFSAPSVAQSNLRLADACRSECDLNVNVCLKYLEACHQPGSGCETRRASCLDTQTCYRTCR